MTPLHSGNVLDTITGLVHAPYARLTLDYPTYATACFDHLPVVRLRATSRQVTCLGCVVTEASHGDTPEAT